MSIDTLVGNPEYLRFKQAQQQTLAVVQYAELPVGDYNVVVVNTTLNSNAKPSIKFTLKVIEGEHTGKYTRMDWWLTEAAAPYTTENIRKIGAADENELLTPAVRGKRLRVTVKERLREGKLPTLDVNMVEVLA